MAVIIPDDVLRAAGMSEEEATVEIACRLFEAGKLTLWAAAKMAHRSRVEFEHELLKRRIPWCRPTLEDLSEDLSTLDDLAV